MPSILKYRKEILSPMQNNNLKIDKGLNKTTENVPKYANPLKNKIDNHYKNHSSNSQKEINNQK